jgi:hypothetical protein
VEKSPSATFCAAASSRRSRFACAPAASQPAASAAASAIIPAIRILRRINATLSSTSPSGVDSTATQRGLPRTSNGTASPCAGRPARRRNRLNRWPPRRGAEIGEIAVRPSSESPTANPGAGRWLRAHPEQRHARVGPLGDAAHQAPNLAFRRPAPHRIGEPAALVGAHLLEPLQLLGGQARAELGHHVEIDEPDRRRGDHEEQRREAITDAVHSSESRKR